MHAGTNRISLFRQKRAIRLRDQIRERLKIRGPSFTVSIVPRLQLFREFQRPRPTVSPLERLPVWLLHVFNFGPNVLGGQICTERTADLRGFGKIRKRLQSGSASSDHERTNASRNSQVSVDAAPWDFNLAPR